MGGVWGGRSPPQGHSPNDMVICVSNLPYWMVFRGPLGVLGGSFGGPGGPVGVQGGQGASWEGLGIREGPGGGLKNMTFCFVRGEFVNGLMKY